MKFTLASEEAAVIKKHRLRRVLWTHLCVVLLVSGCGGGAENKTADENSPAYYSTSAVSGTGQKALDLRVGLDGFVSVSDSVGQLMERRLNIHLTPVDAGEWDEPYLETLASTGTLPDLLRVDIDTPYFIRWLENGTIRELSEARFKSHTRLKSILDGSDESRAMQKIYGNKMWFVPVSDTEKYLIADSGRIYYRKDWAEAMALSAPETIADYRAMLKAFSQSNAAGLSLAGGVTYLVSLFGVDPESWIWEDGEWIPAFYSERMTEGLAYARSLYADGSLAYAFAATKSNAAINQFASGASGSLIRQGDAYWMNRVVGSFASANGIDAAQALSENIGVLAPPSVEGGGEITEARRFWPRSVVTGGCVVSASVNNEKLDRILTLLEYTLSDEGRELAYFGIRGETCATGADGKLKLLVDPSTAKPFQITQSYPAAMLLFILDRGRYRLGEYDTDIPSDLQPALKTAGYEAAGLYNEYAIDEGDGFLIRFLHTPAKEAFEAAVDYNAAFNAIVTGHDPVEEMFAIFRAECEEKNIRAAIDEVNARMSEIN